MARFHLRCHECGAVFAEGPARLVCDACSSLQLPGGPTRGVLEVVLESPPTNWPASPPSSPEALARFLPVRGPGSFPPFPVGGTPLLEAPRLRRELGMPRLRVKDDTRNPSGSTKDRASLLVVAKALEYGAETVATASTGNAATALAAVSAAAGVRAVVFVPASAPPAKLVQIATYGAALLPVEGSYDDAFELCLSACARFGWYNRNTALNPFTIEGKKTAALEIAAAMAPECPDAVVVPTGDGVILAGVAKGFADLRAAGLIPTLPRLIAVQPEGSAAIVRAFAAGSTTVGGVPGAASVADSLVVSTPRNGLLALARLRECRGAALAVGDDAILAAIPRLARLAGVFAEPAAAAALAGLEAALERGLVERDERVVLLVTGTGLRTSPPQPGPPRSPRRSPRPWTRSRRGCGLEPAARVAPPVAPPHRRRAGARRRHAHRPPPRRTWNRCQSATLDHREPSRELLPSRPSVPERPRCGVRGRLKGSLRLRSLPPGRSPCAPRRGTIASCSGSGRTPTGRRSSSAARSTRRCRRRGSAPTSSGMGTAC